MGADILRDPGFTAEQEPSRYAGMEAHWLYVNSLLKGNPDHRALAVASFDWGLTDPHLTPLHIREYEAKVVAAGSHEEYLKSQKRFEDGSVVRFNFDPESYRFHIGQLFYKAGAEHNLNNYPLASSARREVIIYTDDGIFFMNGGQMLDLRAAEQAEQYGDGHWDVNLRNLPPLTIGQPWQFDVQDTLPPIQGFEVLLATVRHLNDTSGTLPTLGPDVFSNARKLYERGKPAEYDTTPDV
jgi:hypothetical protein